LCALALLTGCGGRDSTDRASAPGASAPGASTPGASASDDLDRCALLKDAEISEAIGPHDPGKTDISNNWGTQSCRWTATRAQPMEGNPEGWHDAIEVAVFDATMTPMVRGQVTGDPVAGALPGARYDRSYGDLWFDCPGGRLCAVKARTASGDRRQEIATHLAGLVESRLR
jgi:hypothetical protein